MSDVFILQNQDKLLLGKNKEWLDGRDPGSLFKTLHKDEAINQMVEMSSKDYTQRIKLLPCALNDKGVPVIDPELLPPPQPKAAKVVSVISTASAEEMDEEVLEFSADSEAADSVDPQKPLM